jgi:hypothetical protein
MIVVEEESAEAAWRKGAMRFDVPDRCVAVRPMGEVDVSGWSLTAGELESGSRKPQQRSNDEAQPETFVMSVARSDPPLQGPRLKTAMPLDYHSVQEGRRRGYCR